LKSNGINASNDLSGVAAPTGRGASKSAGGVAASPVGGGGAATVTMELTDVMMGGPVQQWGRAPTALNRRVKLTRGTTVDVVDQSSGVGSVGVIRTSVDFSV